MCVLCIFGQHNYGDPNRGEGYEYSNFVPTLRRLGHEVLFLESRNRTCYRNFRELNAALLDTVEQNRPDVVFAVLVHYEIWLETWEILRDAGVAATVNWTTDDSWRYDQFSRLVAPAFHAFTTTYPAIYARYQREGISHVLLTQWAANAANLQAPLPATQCQYAVSFVGTAHSKRPAWVAALRQRGIDVTCFGYGWPHGPVSADDIPEIIRSSVISLNFASGAMAWNKLLPCSTNQVKARTFEVPGAGGFLLTEWAEDLDRYYTPGREIATFRDLDELEDKIRHYLAHPTERDAIARAGHERTRSEHTYDQRLAEVLEFALRQREEYFAGRDVSPTGQIDWARFEEATQSHRMDRKLLLLKRALVAACSVVWGPVRGPRAARRLVFELSWRMAGARTYSAAGLPGRMFYSVS
jgi:spore maturation protein CgeB